MAEKERKIVLEREYVVPLRDEWLKVPLYKRANKAVKALKQFMVRHMKVYDRDLRKIKVDIYLNNEIKFRGMKKPLAFIKVKAIKYDDGIVEVKLVDLPKHIEFEIARNAKREAEKTKQAKPKKPEEAKVEESQEEKQDIKEKEISSKEAMQEIEKENAKIAKKTSSKSAPELKRKIMQR